MSARTRFAILNLSELLRATDLHKLRNDHEIVEELCQRLEVVAGQRKLADGDEHKFQLDGGRTAQRVGGA